MRESKAIGSPEAGAAAMRCIRLGSAGRGGVTGRYVSATRGPDVLGLRRSSAGNASEGRRRVSLGGGGGAYEDVSAGRGDGGVHLFIGRGSGR